MTSNINIKVVGVGAGEGDAEAIACAEEVRNRQQIEYQLDRLTGRNRRQSAFVMEVVGQAQVIEGSLAQSAVRCSQIALSDISRFVAIHLFEVDEEV